MTDAAQVAERFGLGTVRKLSDGPVARGKQGEVWRLDTADGRWAVKVPFREPEPAEESTRFHEAAYAAGVPAPPVRRTVDGEIFARVGDRPVRVYGWVDLGRPDKHLDPETVGATVAALHRVRLPADGPVHPWYTEPIGADGWDALIARLHTEGAPFAGRLAALRDELVALEAWLEPPTDLQVCHCDLWADNVLPTADGSTADGSTPNGSTPNGGICVIDWENSGPADPSQELACVLFEFGRGDPGRARALLNAYTAAGGPGTVDRPGHFSMLIAQLGHINEAAATDWLEPNVRNPDRAGAEAWIAETLDDPHTRAALTALIAPAGP